MNTSTNLFEQISISTDFEMGKGYPIRTLYQIAEAGFTHLLWCHHSGADDHFYSYQEIKKIKKLLVNLNLSLLDIHAPKGEKWNWVSLDRDTQQLGLSMLKNRIEMTSELEGNSVMIHWYAEPMLVNKTKYWDTTRKALESVEKVCKRYNVKLSIENLDKNEDNFPYIKDLLKMYPSDFLGLCYDSGHGNLQGNGLDNLEKVTERLVSMHLSDNFGLNEKRVDRGDLHQLPFDGTVDWDRLTTLIAVSNYNQPLSFEILRDGYKNISIKDFLAKAFLRASKIAKITRLKREKFSLKKRNLLSEVFLNS